MMTNREDILRMACEAGLRNSNPGMAQEVLRFAAMVIAAHEAAKPGWQPIETAPKDGTNVLLLNDKGNMAAGLWLDGVLGSGWFLRGGNKPDYFFNNHRGPTHWMPLPPPPVIAQAVQQ